MEQSLENTVYWMRRAADQDDVTAEYNMAVIYEKGAGVEQSYEQAFYFYKKAAAQGDLDAMYYLGVMTYNGQGVPYNGAAMAAWYKMAADDGHPKAQYQMGLLHNRGDILAHNDRKAVQWWRKAADQANSKAMFSLGVAYSDGMGVMQSYKKANEWFEKAVALGNTEAMHNLGYAYARGWGVELDMQEAHNYWYRAALGPKLDGKGGLMQTQFVLGGYHLEGDEGFEKDDQRAYYFFSHAAQQGHSISQYNLGAMFNDGKGVPKDLMVAEAWYERAAAQNNSKAMIQIGDLYASCPDDNFCNSNKAINWYKRAAALGERVAEEKLERAEVMGFRFRRSVEDTKTWVDEKAAEVADAAADSLGVKLSSEEGIVAARRAAQRIEEAETVS